MVIPMDLYIGWEFNVLHGFQHLGGVQAEASLILKVQKVYKAWKLPISWLAGLVPPKRNLFGN